MEYLFTCPSCWKNHSNGKEDWGMGEEKVCNRCIRTYTIVRKHINKVKEAMEWRPKINQSRRDVYITG